MDSVHAHGLLRRVAVGLVAGITGIAGVGLGLATLPAAAATSHRAAVVVEVNGVIHTAKITFSTDSISGLDALRSGGFDPTVRVFGGNGGAVCALKVGTTTIGCPADDTCLKCDAHSAYWAYFRALAGATSYTYSVVGAGNTQVHDGDVEAWAWGTGSPPSPFVSFADVWGSDATTTTRSVSTVAPTTRPSSPTTSGSVNGLGSATTTASAAPPSTSASAHASTTTRASRTASTTTSPTTDVRVVRTDKNGRKVATAPVVATGNGGSPFGLVAFAVILAALVGAIVFARRRRSAAAM
jgi:hypothetical protein